MTHTYQPKGVCSRNIDIEIENGIITDIEFMGGCNGNLKGLSKLCIGKTAQEVVDILKGLTCGSKPTSCPDQLAKALEEIMVTV